MTAARPDQASGYFEKLTAEALDGAGADCESALLNADLETMVRTDDRAAIVFLAAAARDLRKLRIGSEEGLRVRPILEVEMQTAALADLLESWHQVSEEIQR